MDQPSGTRTAVPSIVETLRATLIQLEESEELSAKDPALQELRSSILRIIANREIEVGEEAELRRDTAA